MVDNIKDLVIWNSGGICPAARISRSLKVSFRVSFSTRRGVFFVTASLPRAFARNFILSSDMIGYRQRVEKMGNAERASHRNHAIKVGPDTNDSGTCRRAAPVIDAFDPWARQGGEYYSLQ